jgi:saccharopine dehydrogenase-like NADP-dependent oxidoreductase
MKVLIVGGYAGFGGRLTRLLLGDGAQVSVAGRDLRQARAFTCRYGGEALQLDVNGDLTPILRAAPDFVVDAVGPFHAYCADPYRLARFCIANNIHYLDLCEDAAFAAGISSLDTQAKAANCVILSGVSSVLAIASCAVAHLSKDLAAILLIETTILPDAGSPLEVSVAASALAQIGSPLRLWRGGVWRQCTGWSEPKRANLGPARGGVARLVNAPDVLLFPDVYRARSVICRVGLERWMMNAGLAVLGYLRRKGGVGDLNGFVRPLMALSKALSRLSSGVSGLVVEVIGLKDEQPLRRRWQLTASGGDGAFIPALAARAAIGNHGCLAPGARPFLAGLTLSQISSAAAELSITASCSQEPAPTLFQAALGDRWRQLPPSVQRLHSVQDRESFSGRARVTRGRGLLARLAARCFALPTAGEDVALTLTKSRTPRGEVWQRDFAGRKFRSVLTASARPWHYRERFGALTYEQALPVENATLSFLVERGWFLGVPIPSFLLTRSCAKEFAIQEHFHFDVGLYAPLTGELLVRYQGHVRPDAEEAPGTAGCDTSRVGR